MLGNIDKESAWKDMRVERTYALMMVHAYGYKSEARRDQSPQMCTNFGHAPMTALHDREALISVRPNEEGIVIESVSA